MYPFPCAGRNSGGITFACIHKLVLCGRVVFPPLYTVFGAVLVLIFCADLNSKNLIYLL